MLRTTLLVLVILLLPGVATAQITPPLDTTRVYELEAVVVTADRSASLLASSTGAMSLLREAEVDRLPVHTLADALEQTPGFTFVNLDGLGFEPQAMVRGFYGGGETEYVVVMVDGRPLNNLESGLVNWNQIPLSGIASVEVLRGGASSLYGDAAIGSVVNIVMKPEGRTGAQLSVVGGTYGTFQGQASVQASLNGRPVTVFGDVLQTDGFRDHSERVGGTVGASIGLINAPNRTLRLSTLQHWRDFDVPGPLTLTELQADRTQEAAIYQFDTNEERTHRLALDGMTALGTMGSLSASLTGELRHADIIRTLPLAPGFGDTQNRVVDATRLLSTVQATFGDLPLDSRLTIGADASTGSLDAEYYTVVSGDVGAYEEASGEPGDLDTKGTTRRNMAAGFIQYDLWPMSHIKLSVGGRLDWLNDTFDPEQPAGAEAQDATHTEFSPKVGANVRYVQSARNVGNVYANVSRVFKAPTLDQLFDQRRIPVPFPPFSVSISNDLLVPQTGTSIEAGLYHRTEMSPDLAGELSLAVYQIDMKDELDFDVEQFKTVNIGESRHQGIESGAKLYVQEWASVFANYTLQDVRFSKGENEGNQLKAIPKDFVSAGVTVSHPVGLNGALTVNSARRIWLDDANEIELPNYTTVDARLGYTWQFVTLTLEAFNLFDEEYSTTGFPDPAGTGAVFYYPAAGRSVRLGLGVTL